ncbi:MAG: hypothetical protein E7161_04345 [Firmicutes bacterium]|nr:hypothetical protein [Bacillota bacterium]
MEDKIFLTKEEALKIAKIDNNQIHNFVSTSFALIGVDYNLETFNRYLDEATCIEVGGEHCRGMNHALAVQRNGEVYFFEHNEDKLKELLKEKGVE